MRIQLIQQPSAGDGDHDRELRGIFHRGGWKVDDVLVGDWDVTCVGDDLDLIAVAGGDGTVGRVLAQLAGRPIPVGVVPIGTANNIARALGIPLDAREAVDGWASSDPHRLDLLDITGASADRAVESLGVGVLARLVGTADRSDHLDQLERDDQLAVARRLLAALAREADAVEAEVLIDGERHAGRYIAVHVMNMPYVGPNVQLAPCAVLDDGLVDVVLVPESARESLAALAAAAPDRAPLEGAVVARAREVVLRCLSTAELLVDDELSPCPGSEIVVRPSAVGCVVLRPASSERTALR